VRGGVVTTPRHPADTARDPVADLLVVAETAASGDAAEGTLSGVDRRDAGPMLWPDRGLMLASDPTAPSHRG
jgi:hypothetical protein